MVGGGGLAQSPEACQGELAAQHLSEFANLKVPQTPSCRGFY